MHGGTTALRAGPCKGRTGTTRHLPPRGAEEVARDPGNAKCRHTATLPHPGDASGCPPQQSAESGAHEGEEHSARGLQRTGAATFQLWGCRPGSGHLCFHPLKRHRKPSGNKSHTEQPKAAHTWQGAARGGEGSAQARTPEKQRGRSLPRGPAGRTGEQHVDGPRRTAELQH